MGPSESHPLALSTQHILLAGVLLKVLLHEIAKEKKAVLRETSTGDL